MRHTSALLTATALLLCALTACGGDGSGTADDTANDTKGGSSVTDELKTDPATGTRYTGRIADDVARFGNGYGNTNADKRATGNATANSTLHGSYDNPTGTRAGQMDSAVRTRYEKMLENARVHDTDGFLLDGENASYRTLW